MARTLNAFPSRHGNARYPWDEWLSGSIIQLVQGEDYTSKTQTIVANARLQAKRRGGNLKTQLLEHEGRESIVLQFRAA